jgi:hypothetical protein
MPRIEWQKLPYPVFKHLAERVRQRELSTDDLIQLDAWKQTNPIAPDGPWYKDFGNFKLCGEGPYPKTVLRRDQAAFGQQID